MQHESFLKHYFRVKKTGRKVPPPPRQSNCVVWTFKRLRLRALWYKKAPFNMDVSAKLNNAGKSQWSGERISSALTRQMSTVDRTTPLILMQCESVSRRGLLNITAIKAKCQFPLARHRKYPALSELSSSSPSSTQTAQPIWLIQELVSVQNNTSGPAKWQMSITASCIMQNAEARPKEGPGTRQCGGATYNRRINMFLSPRID